MKRNWPLIERWLRMLSIATIASIGVAYLAIHIAVSPAAGFDGRIYAAAAQAWLAGADPYSVRVEGISLAAPPPSLILAAPLALLPASLVVPVSILVAALAGVVAVRVSGAGWWWLLSIPFVEGIFVGSLDLPAVCFAIVALQSGRRRWRPLAAGLAAVAKIYAIVPSIALGRRDAILGGVTAIAVTAPFLPWREFFAILPELPSILARQAGNGIGSPWTIGWLVPPTILALLLLGRRDGAWLLIPALWPSSQAHYSVFMLPVGSPVLALAFLAPVPASAAVAVIVLAVVRGFQRRLDPMSWLPERVQRRWPALPGRP